MIPYNKRNIPLARELRRNMTPWERKLWYEFLRSYSLRFQRQKAIGEYIADFYCAKARLVIELDGGGHYTDEQRSADEARDASLAAAGLTVLRICNTDVDKDFAAVCEYIEVCVSKCLSLSQLR